MASRDIEIQSGRFKMSGSAFMQRMLSRHAIVPLGVLGLLIVLFLVLGAAIDLRWIVVALMLLFIALPAIMAMIYFNHGMRTSTAFNVLPHTVGFTVDEVVISIFTPPIPENDEKNCDKKETVKFISFPLASLGSPEYSTSAVTIPLNTYQPGFIYIPFESMSDNFADFIRNRKYRYENT